MVNRTETYSIVNGLVGELSGRSEFLGVVLGVEKKCRFDFMKVIEEEPRR